MCRHLVNMSANPGSSAKASGSGGYLWQGNGVMEKRVDLIGDWGVSRVDTREVSGNRLGDDVWEQSKTES